MSLQLLKNKKVLFFSPAFFDYENIIVDEMRNMGAQVRLYDERNITSALGRAILKTFPFVFTKKANRYYQRIINEFDKDVVDYVLIVKCDMVTKDTILAFRKKFPSAKLCLHVWDSKQNIPKLDEKIDLFDYASSFDRGDCIKDCRLKFRPLFFSKVFEKSVVEKKYDIVFCGTIHSDRYYIISKIKKWCSENNRSFYCFAYLQSVFIYFFYRISNKGFKHVKKTDFTFEKKSQNEIAHIESSSKVILDIQHPKQTGLTMRTIEMIGMNKKIITTNVDIKNYDIYDEHNIYIISRHEPTIDLAFLDGPYVEIPERIRNRYMLSNWILDVLGING